MVSVVSAPTVSDRHAFTKLSAGRCLDKRKHRSFHEIILTLHHYQPHSKFIEQQISPQSQDGAAMLLLHRHIPHKGYIPPPDVAIDMTLSNCA